MPQAPKPDADTPADTIKTLTANVSAMTTEVKGTAPGERGPETGQPGADQGPKPDRKHGPVAAYSRPCRRKIQDTETQRQASAQRDATRLAELTARVDTLTQSLSGHRPYPTTAGSASDIPVGLGLDGLGIARRHRRCPGLGAAAGADRHTRR